jgi:hypothetical protein
VRGLTVASVLALLLALATGAQAHHVVWLDFSDFDLRVFPTVNGLPPDAFDVETVRALIVAHIVRDFAPFDVHFTTVEPAHGRHTSIRFRSRAAGPGGRGVFGCEQSRCCDPGTGCRATGIDSWERSFSAAEVYAGSFAAWPEWQGDNATTARIANAIAATGSHELGHILGLNHCHAADDFPTPFAAGEACANGFGDTTDRNVDWHLMQTFAADGGRLTLEDKATRDRFFSVHSERRFLGNRLQARNHWAPMPNVTTARIRASADLVYTRVDPLVISGYVRRSTGLTFGDLQHWATLFGNPADQFFVTDVTGDAQGDLVRASIRDATIVRWMVSASTGTSFDTRGFEGGTLFALDAGSVGDIVRFADVDGDGRADLVLGRPSAFGAVEWIVCLSTGTTFGACDRWLREAGREGDLFLVGDVNGDDRADLVVFERAFSPLARATVSVYESTGRSFSFGGENRLGFPLHGADHVMLGDVDGDGHADLVLGRFLGSLDVSWRVLRGRSCSPFFGCFGFDEEWARTGRAGDLFRLGDVGGDGRLDLFYARPVGIDSLTEPVDPTRITWFGALSNVFAEFGPEAVWTRDAGDDGDLFP